MIAPDPFEHPFEANTTLDIQGVRLRLASNSREFVEYAPLHVQDCEAAVLDRPEVEVNVLWVPESDFDRDIHYFGGLEELDCIGKRMLGNGSDLVCLSVMAVKRLQLRFRVRDDKLVMDAIQRIDIDKKGRGKRDTTLYKEFFRSMLHFVYYPLAWYLEHFRGLHLLHASAVEIDGRAVAICGVGGSGKSTTSVGLLRRAGARFISESLVFYDGRDIYSCYEPVRIGPKSLEMLGKTDDYLLETCISPTAKKKDLFHVDAARITQRAPLGAMFLPSFSDATRARPLDSAQGVDRILSINAQSRKVTDYYWFASALGMAWPRAGLTAGRVAELERLLDRARTFELHIGPGSCISPAIDVILESIG